jgi:hypothetical protein
MLFQAYHPSSGWDKRQLENGHGGRLRLDEVGRVAGTLKLRLVVELRVARGDLATIGDVAHVFSSTFPVRNVAVKRWVQMPAEPIRGLLLLPYGARSGDEPNSA